MDEFEPKIYYKSYYDQYAQLQLEIQTLETQLNFLRQTLSNETAQSQISKCESQLESKFSDLERLAKKFKKENIPLPPKLSDQ